MLSTISQIELCSVMVTFVNKPFFLSFFNNLPEQHSRMAFHSMYFLLKKKEEDGDMVNHYRSLQLMTNYYCYEIKLGTYIYWYVFVFSWL